MVNFNFSFDPGTNLQQMVGFEIAGRIWSSYLKDPITLNLQVGVSSSLGSNVIGGALPGILASSSYSSYRNQLAADRTSIDDDAAISSLTSSLNYSTSYDVFIDGANSRATGSTGTVNMTRAVAKATGINLTDSATALDGYILFSDLSAQSKVTWNYDYTRSQTMASNSLDFLSTAVHEIGHILGFVSGIDKPGWLDSSFSSSSTAPITSYVGSMQTRVQNSMNPLDLFRYSAASAASRTTNFSYGSRGGNKYLSLDNGATTIASFATGVDNSVGGDGYQASHWKAGTSGIMAPTLKTGTRADIGSVDLRTLDVIGWDLAPKSSSTSSSLSTFQAQAQQSLASRLGKTVSWLTANATTAAQQLTKDGSQAVYAMAVNSQVYDLNRITAPTAATTASLTYNQLFQEQGLFETIDELEVLPEVSMQPSRAALAWDSGSNLNQITPPTPGASIKVTFNLPGLDLNRPTPPTPAVPPTVILNPLSSFSQNVQSLLTGTVNTALVRSLLQGTTNYFYGSSKSVADAGSNKSAQQQFAPLSVLVDLSVML